MVDVNAIRSAPQLELSACLAPVGTRSHEQGEASSRGGGEVRSGGVLPGHTYGAEPLSGSGAGRGPGGGPVRTQKAGV